MRRKLKILFRIFLIVLITVLCIIAGINTRHKKAIVVSGFTDTYSDLKSGYLLESETGRLVMIDGGSSRDSKTVLDEIKRKGGNVEVWFITLPYADKAEVLLDALNDDEIEIGGIYLSVNSEEWYKDFEDKNQIGFVQDFLDIMKSDEVRDRVHEVQAKDEIDIDNLNFKILKVKNPEYTKNAGINQSMVLRVSNNFKNIIFLNSFGTEYQTEFLNDNQDEIKVQDINLIENRIENYMTGKGNIVTVEIY